MFATSYLPLQIQRFQLAMYGMDEFKPKSTDWLRVTLFQGAPRLERAGALTPPTTGCCPFDRLHLTEENDDDHRRTADQRLVSRGDCRGSSVRRE